MNNTVIKKEPSKSSEVPGSSMNPVTISGDDTITIKNLVIKSKEVHEYLSNADNLSDACLKVIITGCLALQRAQSSIDSDFIEKKISEALNQIESHLQSVIDPATQGSLGQRLNEIFKVQNENLRGLLSKGNEASSDLNSKITTFTEKLRKELDNIISQQLTSEDGKVGLIINQLRKDVADLRDTIIQKETHTTSSAPQIGMTFEESCKTILEKFCANQNLILEDLRTVAGAGLSKKGDFRITGKGFSPIVLEMKNHSSRISHPAIIKEIEEACENRGAEIGILVADADSVPQSLGVYAEYDAKIICTFESFEIALKVALAKSRLMTSQHRINMDIDINTLNIQLGELKTAITKFNKLRSNCAALKKTAGKIEDIVKELKSQLITISDHMIEALNPKQEEKSK